LDAGGDAGGTGSQGSALYDARGDADGGRRGRVDCFAIAGQLTGRPYGGTRKGNGGTEQRAGLDGRPAPTTAKATADAGPKTQTGPV
jgi:hypothetical protein